MSMKYTLRLAKPDDAEKLLEIYAPFVISNDRALSDVSFEYEVPSIEEFTERIKNISADYPYIVCEYDGRLLGYVYAHPYIQRAAYQWGAEVTIYLAPEGQGRGLGKVMYAALEALLRLQGIVRLAAIKLSVPSIIQASSTDIGWTWCGWRRLLPNIPSSLS